MKSLQRTTSNLGCVISSTVHRRAMTLVGRFNTPPFHVTLSSLVESALSRECDRLEALSGQTPPVPLASESSNAYVTPKEAATILRRSTPRILQMIKEKRFRAAKAGRFWKISRSDVLSLAK